LEQMPDCSARGTVFMGLREPEDEGRRRRFRELSVLLKLRPHVSSRIDLEALADSHDLDPDVLEQDLVQWSLDRLLTFSSSQRFRRVRLLSAHVDSPRLRDEIRSWNIWQRRQLDAVIGYAESRRCRRSSIVEYFGFPAYTCDDERERARCDKCGGHSAWLDVGASDVPDPEQLVNVELVVLQAVAWASTLTTGRYGEGGLKAAVLGVEGRELGAGLRRCPQFGALRHVRGAERRWDQAMTALAGDGLVNRDAVQRDGRTYTSPSITALGHTRLGGPRG
jgi:ATP-dependent DNA helicase RecQ